MVSFALEVARARGMRTQRYAVPFLFQTTDVQQMRGELEPPACANVDHCGPGSQYAGFGETDVLQHALGGRNVFPDNAGFAEARLQYVSCCFASFSGKGWLNSIRCIICQSCN